MFRRDVRPAAAVAAAVITVATATVLTGGTAQAAAAPNAGPDSCPGFHTELITKHKVVPMKNAARISRTDCGYRYRAGQQSSHLTIKQVGNNLVFRDPRTERFDALADGCRQIRGVPGVAAECRIPSLYSVSHRLLVEVWPRLGNDYVDASTLSAMFSVTVLADKGDDTALLGAGPDFFNGFVGHDFVSGGAGDDWIRTGDWSDRIKGGPGSEHLSGGYGNDTINGGDGSDRLYCGPGRDKALRDGSDSTVFLCERVSYL